MKVELTKPTITVTKSCYFTRFIQATRYWKPEGTHHSQAAESGRHSILWTTECNGFSSYEIFKTTIECKKFNSWTIIRSIVFLNNTLPYYASQLWITNCESWIINLGGRGWQLMIDDWRFHNSDTPSTVSRESSLSITVSTLLAQSPILNSLIVWY